MPKTPEEKKLEINPIETERLLLDDSNPRLVGINDAKTQDQLTLL